MDNTLFDALAEVMETVFRYPVNQQIPVWVNCEDEPRPLHPSLVSAVQILRREYEAERIRREDEQEGGDE